jgi:polycystin 1L2
MKEDYILDKDKKLDEKKSKKKTKKKKINKKLSFPWWFKIIGYLLSAVFMAVSVFFIIVRGIEFGDEKVKKWLTSLLVSFISSIFLTQPVKVFLITFFAVLVCRTSNDDNDLEFDYDDDQDAINKSDEWKNFSNEVNYFFFLLEKH